MEINKFLQKSVGLPAAIAFAVFISVAGWVVKILVSTDPSKLQPSLLRWVIILAALLFIIFLVLTGIHISSGRRSEVDDEELDLGPLTVAMIDMNGITAPPGILITTVVLGENATLNELKAIVRKHDGVVLGLDFSHDVLEQMPLLWLMVLQQEFQGKVIGSSAKFKRGAYAAVASQPLKVVKPEDLTGYLVAWKDRHEN